MSTVGAEIVSIIDILLHALEMKSVAAFQAKAIWEDFIETDGAAITVFSWLVKTS